MYVCVHVSMRVLFSFTSHKNVEFDLIIKMKYKWLCSFFCSVPFEGVPCTQWKSTTSMRSYFKNEYHTANLSAIFNAHSKFNSFFFSSTRNRIFAEIYYMHSAHTFNFTINENQIKLWRKKRTKAHAFFSSFFYFFLPVLYKYTANFVRFSVSLIQSEPINPIFCHRKLNINQRKSMPTIFAEKFWVTQ